MAGIVPCPGSMQMIGVGGPASMARKSACDGRLVLSRTGNRGRWQLAESPVRVPRITGLAQTPLLNRPTADQSKDGLVVEEQPHAGSSIPGGSKVTIFVGRFTG